MLIRTFVCLSLLLAAFPATAATLVPPGNRSATQPPVPAASASRTRAAQSTYDAKYRKVYDLLKNDAQLRAKIKAAAALYNIDPLHIVGAIVGEHTYNVDAYDRLQTYYVKAVAYLQTNFSFSHNREAIDDFVKRPQFSKCEAITESYSLWSCREAVWERDFRGKKVEGASFPDNRFSAVFFQPFYAGQTFGIGQLNPLTALQMSDLVARTSGLPKLDHRNAKEVYRTIMDPDLTLAYVAATLKKSIDAYRTIADFDISKNPGVTATLYNIGNPEQRARALKAQNQKLRAAGLSPRLPAENYYGWLVNTKLSELKELF